MCGCERIWRGVVLDYKHKWTNSHGIRTYLIKFHTGEAVYEISGKREFNIKRGQMMYFSGVWLGPDDGDRYYLIRKVYSQEEMIWLHEVERKKQMMIMS